MLSACACVFLGENEAQHGEDVFDDAPIGERLFQADADRDATSQLRHANQLPRTCRRIQTVAFTVHAYVNDCL